MKLLLISFICFITSSPCYASGDIEVTKEYKMEADGLEWYEIRHWNTKTYEHKYGAEDLHGRILVPVEYDFVHYWDEVETKRIHGFNGEGYFRGVKKEQNTDPYGRELEYFAIYSKTGACLSPIQRKMRTVIKCHLEDGTEYFYFVRGDDFKEYGILDSAGNILFKRLSDRPVLFCKYFVKINDYIKHV